MPNYLTIDEAVNLSGLSKETFVDQYIERGVISVKVEDGVKTVELSEFLRVFPDAKASRKNFDNDIQVEVLLKQQKIENLEYQVVQLQRQLEKQTEDYNWLRNKFDSTTLLLEQKLDTSELDQHKQEIKKLGEQSIQWEKKYNTLLAASELKTLIKENKELKEKLESLAHKVAAVKTTTKTDNSSVTQLEQTQISPLTPARTEEMQSINEPLTNNIPSSLSNQQSNSNPKAQFQYSPAKEHSSISIKPKRRKIFGIF